MKNYRVEKSDFEFRFMNYGLYWVVYQYPKSKRRIGARVNDMVLLDLTKNCENPRQKDLQALKTHIVRHGIRLCNGY